MILSHFMLSFCVSLGCVFSIMWKPTKLNQVTGWLGCAYVTYLFLQVIAI